MQADDKIMVMERTIQLVATMPNSSTRQEVLTNVLIDQLWNSLAHPPLLYMGDEFRYRQPDGSNNVRPTGFPRLVCSADALRRIRSCPSWGPPARRTRRR